MRHYELVVVLSPMISPDEASQAWERIKGFITTREAEIVHEERWGTRRLAYPVKKGQFQFLEGNYHLTRFATDASFNRDLENYLKLDDIVLRSLVTVTVTEEELSAHAAQTRAPRPPRAPAAAAPPGGGPASAAEQANAAAPGTPAPETEGTAATVPEAAAEPPPEAAQAPTEGAATVAEAATEPSEAAQAPTEGAATGAEAATEPSEVAQAPTEGAATVAEAATEPPEAAQASDTAPDGDPQPEQPSE